MKTSRKHLTILAILFLLYFSTLIGRNLLISKNYNEFMKPSNNHKHETACFTAERSYYFIVDGVRYSHAQFFDVEIPETVTPKKFLGYLTELEGTYQLCPSENGHGGVYTIKEDDDILVVFNVEQNCTEYFVPENWG